MPSFNQSWNVIFCKTRIDLNTYALPILCLLLLCDLGFLHFLRFPQLILCWLIQIAWLNLNKLQWIVGRFWGCRLSHSLLLHILCWIKGWGGRLYGKTRENTNFTFYYNFDLNYNIVHSVIKISVQYYQQWLVGKRVQYIINSYNN